MKPRSFALFSGCTLLFAYFAAFHAPAELSGWLRCFHSKFSRESSQVFVMFPIVAARCRCSLGNIRRARTHCKVLRRLPCVPRPPVRFRILRRAAGGLADFADGAARSKNSDHPVSSSLQKKRGWPKDYFIIRPRTGALHAPIYCLATSQGLARCTCSAGRHWWACIFSPSGGATGRKRRAAPCRLGVSAVAPEALLAGTAVDGVIILGRPHGQPRPCQQQAICSV